MNSWRRRKYEDWLVPYAEGALDAERRAELEAQLARDPALAAEAEAQRRVAQRLHEIAAAEDAAPVTATLWPQIEARIQPKRRAVGPLIWAGGACAAACLAWAALWGPLGDSAPQTVWVPPPVVETAPGGPPTAASPVERPTHHVRVTRVAVKAATTPIRPVPVVIPATPSDRMADRNSGFTPAPTAAVETTPPAPRAAVAVSGAARFQTAEGVREKASEPTDSAPAPAPQSQNDAEAGTAAPVSHAFAADHSTQTALPDAAASSAAPPPAAAPPVKRRHRHHRRSRKPPVLVSPATPAPSETPTPQPPGDVTNPPDNTPPITPPKPTPMPSKPVE